MAEDNLYNSVFWKTLNLDDPSTWRHPYSKLKDSFGLNGKWEEILNPPRQSLGYNQGLLQRIERAVRKLGKRYFYIQKELSELFSKNYQFVIGFHCCRPLDINSYKIKGILPANSYRMLREAIYLFGNTIELRRALRDLEGYPNLDRGKISFYISKRHIKPDYNFLKYGSECISSIATRIGKWAKDKIRNHGNPIILTCKIPINDLPPDIIDSYAEWPLIVLIEGEWCITKAAFRLEKPIPPDRILEIEQVKM